MNSYNYIINIVFYESCSNSRSRSHLSIKRFQTVFGHESKKNENIVKTPVQRLFERV